MSIFGAAMLFVLLILFYMAIAEIFTVLFRFTGLPAEKARFQVVSLLTGSGFTTRESELVVNSRSRRKLARITMLFGYVFNITIVSAFVNVFFSLKQAEITSLLWGLPVPLAVLGLILLLQKNKTVKAWENRVIERIAGRITNTEHKNHILLLDYIGSSAMAQVTIAELPEALAGVPLADTGLKSENGILVMLLERRGGEPLPVSADTVFLSGDRLTLLGALDDIRSAFNAEEQALDGAEAVEY
ncbi:MAG: TrkA C-terminal domain-containing protein [Oscillospiraceae bacterium]